MSHDSDSKQVRIIDLARSRAPGAFRDHFSLWEPDLGRIYRLIHRHIAVVENHPKGDDDQRPPHLSIAIFGPSGSGKSSLIRTLVDSLNRPSSVTGPAESPTQGLHEKVVPLQVMDPTTWAETDQFLYAFLAAALEKEQDHLEDRQHGILQGLTPVQLAFQEVNEYLRVVDEPAHATENDPLGLSLQKLERHTSALRLRKTLANFVDKLAAELNARVILLPIDDLDMAPDHLIDSLKAYQSFLMHPKLVPVFTFTDRMPEELIEVAFRRRLQTGGAASGGKSQDRLGITEQLAVQFLARCFPVRNRIRLGPAPARVQRARYTTQPEKDQPSKDKIQQEVLELLITASFLLFGHPDKEDAHRVRAALRPSTLRRQIQVVDAMADCRLHALRVPQLVEMTEPIREPAHLAELLEKTLSSPPTAEQLKVFAAWQARDGRLNQHWSELSQYCRDTTKTAKNAAEGYRKLAHRLWQLQTEATWGYIFNGATWSLLNVHRDTLRELGLFLEDLYSWSPRELRSVVLEKILAQDREIRRRVVDRWFNRSDVRRSQVLSLLAANVFRPCMSGEEPYGDEESALHRQRVLEKHPEKALDRRWPAAEHTSDSVETRNQVRERLAFRSAEGLLWFINVTLSFYLPQIMARDWSEAMIQDSRVRDHMTGSGWDLQHAPINAIRAADARREVFSFGMLFLDPRGYGHALEPEAAFLGKVALKLEALVKPGLPAEEQEGLGTYKDVVAAATPRASARGRLLLRLWTCCGYSNGRLWAAFSLWRGLSLIGRALELALWHRQEIEKLAELPSPKRAEGKLALNKHKERLLGELNSEPTGDEPQEYRTWKKLCLELERLLRSHCLEGLVPGSLLNRDTEEKRILFGFPHWEPHGEHMEKAIRELAMELVEWLAYSWQDLVFPLPAGTTWIGWRDCFVRRIHGDLILGSLWPQLNAPYMQAQKRYREGQILARLRSLNPAQLSADDFQSPPPGQAANGESYRWTAALAASAWSNVLLEYWRGCPPILKLLLTCPVFLRSPQHFGPEPKKDGTVTEAERDEIRTILNAMQGRNPDKKLGTAPRYRWLDRLALPFDVWKSIAGRWKSKNNQLAIEPSDLIPDEFCIERVAIEEFAPQPAERVSVKMEKTHVLREGGKVTAISSKLVDGRSQ